MTENISAVTSVIPSTAVRLDTPEKKPRAKKAPAAEASTGKGRGRPALTLRGGKLYAEAKAEAAQAVRDARDAVRDTKATAKDLDKAAKAAAKTLASHEKALEKQLAKPNADKAIQRDTVRDLKADIKDAKAASREAEKASKAAAKDLERAEKALEKARAAVEKVEEAKAAALAKAA